MIGVLGGTFDPIHFGHLRTALDVMQGVGLHELRFVPLHTPVHRSQPVASGELRLEMVRRAIRHQSGFTADARELQREGDSYMVDTLASMREEMGDLPLCLIIGGDAFTHFLSWRQPHAILKLAHLIVMQRPGHAQIQDPALLHLLVSHQIHSPEALEQKVAGHIFFQPVTQLEISSTRIRDLIDSGRSPRYLLPETVLELIESNGLYHI